MKVITIIVLAAVALFGCAGLQNPAMSAEQITAAAKAKDANVVCVKATGPWGAATTTYVNVDKDVVKNGQVTVNNECNVTYSNVATPKVQP